jgi:hypothetical protein
VGKLLQYHCREMEGDQPSSNPIDRGSMIPGQQAFSELEANLSRAHVTNAHDWNHVGKATSARSHLLLFDLEQTIDLKILDVD